MIKLNQDIDQERTQREAVVAEAREWLGTPYHHRAQVMGAGVDCGQLLVAVYVACGLVAPFETGDYPADWMLHREEERYLGWVKKFAVETATPQPGDIVVWQFGRCISHGGIVVEWPQIIHAYRPECMCVLGDGSIGDLAHRKPRFFTIWPEREI
ncbi:MAG TPA: NlpC/P60 family protein [Burkholderiaceae bacterium]|jgi:NlpC/P60 family putative phage cell wall peptidase|nr:NlpC/P60 family protein [Burkholderiaceae bacterium]